MMRREIDNRYSTELNRMDYKIVEGEIVGFSNSHVLSYEDFNSLSEEDKNTLLNKGVLEKEYTIKTIYHKDSFEVIVKSVNIEDIFEHYIKLYKD